jgi:hypothetical protein
MKHFGKAFSTIKKLVRDGKRDAVLIAKAETSLSQGGR